MDQIIISSKATPGLIQVLQDKLCNRREVLNVNTGLRKCPMTREEALKALFNLSIACDDPNARSFFGGLYESLNVNPVNSQ